MAQCQNMAWRKHAYSHSLTDSHRSHPAKTRVGAGALEGTCRIRVHVSGSGLSLVLVFSLEAMPIKDLMSTTLCTTVLIIRCLAGHTCFAGFRGLSRAYRWNPVSTRSDEVHVTLEVSCSRCPAVAITSATLLLGEVRHEGKSDMCSRVASTAYVNIEHVSEQNVFVQRPRQEDEARQVSFSCANSICSLTQKERKRGMVLNAVSRGNPPVVAVLQDVVVACVACFCPTFLGDWLETLSKERELRLFISPGGVSGIASDTTRISSCTCMIHPESLQYSRKHSLPLGSVPAGYMFP